MNKNEWRLFAWSQDWKGSEWKDQQIEANLQRLGLSIASLMKLSPHDANAALRQAQNSLNSIKPIPPTIIITEIKKPKTIFKGKVPKKTDSDGQPIM